MLTLIGETGTKRTEYFRKAAESSQVPLSVIEWNEIEKAIHHSELERAVIKIDPPSYRIISLKDMKQQIKAYQEYLQKLAHVNALFLNTPGAVAEVLDKRSCKQKLQAAKVPVTELVLEKAESTEQLLTQMEEAHQFSVFLKPVCFSGAAGVVAFRIQPRTGKMQAYTSCKLVEKNLVNTKILYCMNDRKEIVSLLDKILNLDVMVERWLPKSAFQGKSYDLRVVYQFGHIAHIVVRQAKGPITNLHLNNQALRIEELGLSQEKFQELEQVCSRAAAAFPGFTMAGIDVLLEKNTGKPYIIEMNGQGDLIYQDIYGKNRIYTEQIKWLSEHGERVL